MLYAGAPFGGNAELEGTLLLNAWSALGGYCCCGAGATAWPGKGFRCGACMLAFMMAADMVNERKARLGSREDPRELNSCVSESSPLCPAKRLWS